MNHVRKTGKNNRVVRTHPLSQAEKKRTSKNVCVSLYHLVLCNVVFLSMTLMCLFNVTANTVLVNVVSLHEVLYDMECEDSVECLKYLLIL